ncbi:MAG TPA: hypothetical protein VH186_17460 [Chloroflexia bacterium]|nr:hypothetical protein [Chloroflexia bacterium]
MRKVSRGYTQAEISEVVRQGITPQGFARIFIVLLILLGSIGPVFPYPGSISTAEAADLSTGTRAKSTTAVSPLRSSLATVSPSSVCLYQAPDVNTNTPMKGIAGNVVQYNSSGAAYVNPQFPFTVAVLDASNSSYPVLEATQAANGPYIFNNGTADFPSIVPNKVFILQFSHPNTSDPTTYFDYFKGGAGEIGRFSTATATRLYLDGSCTAYALVEPLALPDPSIALPAPNLPGVLAGTVAITMTSSLANRFFDGAAITGRAVGGRLFNDNGSNAPTPFYQYPTGAPGLPAVNVYGYDYTNNTLSASPIITTAADPAGYYTVAGTSANNVLDPTVSRTIALGYSDPGYVVNSYYCNVQVPDSLSPSQVAAKKATIYPVSLPTSLSTSQVYISPPVTTGPNGNSSCTAASGPLSAPGFNQLVRPDVQIQGIITTNNGATPLQGAIAVAIRADNGQVDATSAPSAADGSYTIPGLQPQTNYIVRFDPPSSSSPPNGNLIGEYYNNVPLDKQNLATQVPTGSGYGTLVTSGINGDLEAGWFMGGNVTLAGSSSSVTVEVDVYDASNTTTPVLIAQATGSNGIGSYTTLPQLYPGKTYLIFFKPTGTNSNYSSAWCGTDPNNANNCLPVFTPGAAKQFTIDGVNTPRTSPITANITLFSGVIVQGQITGVNPNNTSVNLSNLQTSVTVNVYSVNVDANGKPTQLNPATPVQSFIVDSTSSGGTYNYSTSALTAGTNYVLEFVPTTQAGDAGFLKSYYAGPNLQGVSALNQAAVINKSTNGVYTGFNIKIVRAAGLKMQVLTWDNFPFQGVSVAVYKSGQGPQACVSPNNNPIAAGTPIASGTTDNNGNVTIVGIDTLNSPVNLYLTTPNGYIVKYSGSDCYHTSVPATNVALTAGQVLDLGSYNMPKIILVGGAITVNGSNGTNWTGSQLQVLDQNKNVYLTSGDTPNGPVLIRDTSGNNSNVWTWQAYIQPGTYYFSIIPPNGSPYVQHWYIGGGTGLNGANPNNAASVQADPSSTLNSLNIDFTPGGVLKVQVLKPDSTPVSGASINYSLDGINVLPYIGTTSSTGFDYSPPTGQTSGQATMYVKVAVPAGLTGVEPTDWIPFTVSPGQTRSVQIYLQATPFISGIIKSRDANDNETPLSGMEVALVDPTSGAVLDDVNGVYTTTNTGAYQIRMPTVGSSFKLRFRPTVAMTGIETRYWLNTPQQTGTVEVGAATTITRQKGQTYSNYNQFYDLSKPTGCQITDAYVLSATPNSATIRYFTNCAGDSRVGWSKGDPSPTASFVSWSSYANSANYGQSSVTETSGVYSHTVVVDSSVLGTIDPNANYHIRPFSAMPAGSNTITGSNVELSIHLNGDGTKWYFAQGDTTASSTMSTTEVLHLFNYGASTASVNINYYTQANYLGTVTTTPKTVTVQPGSRLDVPVTEVSGVHSTEVTSNQSIMVEKSVTVAGQLSNGYNYNGGYSLPGANGPGYSWYFPEVSNKSGIDQFISVFNPDATNPACVQLSYYPLGSSTSSVTPTNKPFFPLKPHGRIEFATSDATFGIGSGDFALRVMAVSSGYCGGANQVTGVVAEQQTRYAQPSISHYVKGVAGQFGAAGPSQDWFFLDGLTDKAYDIQYSVFNPTNTTGTVTVSVILENPMNPKTSLVKQYTFTVYPNQRTTYTLDYSSINQAAPGQRFGFTARLDSNVPIVAQRTVKYVYNSSLSMEGVYQEMGSLRGSNTWLFAAGDTTWDNTNFNYTEESLNIYNPNLTPVSVNVTYYFDTGAPKLFSNFIIPANGRTNLQPFANPTANYPSVGTGKIIAVKVEAQPINSPPDPTTMKGVFAERMVYWRKGRINGGNAIYGWNPSGT